jgi:hypothetical protein
MTFKTVNSIATSITGKVQNNTVYYTLQLKDVKDVERYLLSGTLKASAGNNELRLDPTKLLLNYESWKVDADNLVRFGTKESMPIILN